MKPSRRTVDKMPITGLWDDAGPIEATRERYVEADEVREIVRLTTNRFVVANMASTMRWVGREDGQLFWDFWHKEVKNCLYRDDRPYLEDYPDEYFYRPSVWRTPSGGILILLEKYH